MFSRSIMTFLLHWKDQPQRKPLVIRGARQVGKTTTVKQFGQTFDVFIYLNLELLADRKLFEQGLSVQQLFSAILLHKRLSRPEGSKVLIFIDEIQYSSAAVSMLRYFYEDCPDIHVIAAGSLLESLMDVQTVFPVGRVEYTHLYPLTFEEFLLAAGEQALYDLLTTEVPGYAHTLLLEWFHVYAMLGGMPEVVASFIQHRDWLRLVPIYESLLLSYQDDVEKYAQNNTQATVLRHVISHAPLQAGSRIKFQNFGQSNYGSREVGQAMRILEKALLIKLVYPTTALKPPFEADHKKSPKLQFLDTGLVNFSVGLQQELLHLKDLNGLYQGKITEHIVGQQLLGTQTLRSTQLMFWVRERAQSNAEIDYVMPKGSQLIPIEIKSGKTGALRSLHSFIDHVERCNVALRLYSGEYVRERIQSLGGKEFELINLPYYLCGQLRRYI